MPYDPHTFTAGPERSSAPAPHPLAGGATPTFREGCQPVDYPVLTLAAIGALNAAVVSADAAVAEAESRRVAVRGKRTALEQRLAAVPVASSEGFDDLETSLADALAADPAAALSEDDFAAATQRRVDARRAREANAAERAVIESAIVKVDEETAAIGDEIETLQGERVRCWKAFLDAAHPYLVDRFRKGFGKLVSETLQAVVDLQSMKIADRNLVPHSAWQIERDSAIKLKRTVRYEGSHGSGSKVEYDTLFEHGYVSPVHGSSDAIDRFRAGLPTDSAK